MSTAIGYKMAGGGVVYHPAGNGIMRKAISVGIRHLGHKAVDAVAERVGGSGYKLTGTGRKRKPCKPKKAGRARKVGRPKKR